MGVVEGVAQTLGVVLVPLHFRDVHTVELVGEHGGELGRVDDGQEAQRGQEHGGLLVEFVAADPGTHQHLPRVLVGEHEAAALHAHQRGLQVAHGGQVVAVAHGLAPAGEVDRLDAGGIDGALPVEDLEEQLVEDRLVAEVVVGPLGEQVFGVLAGRHCAASAVVGMVGGVLISFVGGEKADRRLSASSSRLTPPQIPYGSRLALAAARHRDLTGHFAHTACACRAVTVSDGSGKNSSGSSSLHTARACQFRLIDIPSVSVGVGNSGGGPAWVDANRSTCSGPARGIRHT
ncbi:Uncharacterised protein [Mycobacteroides abscessus]|nr:Uncharacterised protein [Mycobacteroides abscessus]